MAHDEAGSAAIKLSELVEAFEFVSVADLDEHHAYLCRRPGRIFFVSDGIDMEEDDLTEDLDDSERYQAIPHRRDLDLGKKVALSFVEQAIPGSLSEAREIFRSRGAYGRFKHLLQVNGILDKWYAFEETAVEVALKDWCDDVGVTLIDG